MQISGAFEANIRYSAAGSGEKIFVNDQLAATSSIWHLSVVAPQVDFEIESGGRTVPATIHVSASWIQFFRLVGFSLTVNGHLLYIEPDD